MRTKTYTPPTVTVDGVIFQVINDRLNVLLIQRANEPFKGDWALPGGYNAEGETTLEALNRILVQKAGINARQLGVVEQLYTFDAVARDPRGHAVSVTYMGVGKDIQPRGEDVQNPQFFPVDALPRLAYDHKEIVSYAHRRLVSELSNTNIAFALLPEFFTLTQLQSAYEAVIGRSVDKRNFRKKILSLDLIKETSQVAREGAHRPARLYAFKEHTLQTLDRDFG